MNWNNFCNEFFKKLWKNSTIWNIKRFFGDSFVQTNQQSSVLYYRLLDFSTLKFQMHIENIILNFLKPLTLLGARQ